MGPVTSVLAQGFGLERGERTVDVMRPGGFDQREAPGSSTTRRVPNPGGMGYPGPRPRRGATSREAQRVKEDTSVQPTAQLMKRSSRHARRPEPPARRPRTPEARPTSTLA